LASGFTFRVALAATELVPALVVSAPAGMVFRKDAPGVDAVTSIENEHEPSAGTTPPVSVTLPAVLVTTPPPHVVLVFGVAGYFMKKTNYPLAPMVLAIVLGDKAEESFRQSLLASQGGLGVFWSNGLVSTIMTLGLIALFWPLIQSGWTRARGRGGLKPAQ